MFLQAVFRRPDNGIDRTILYPPLFTLKEPTMDYSSADFQDKHTTALEEIDEAAWEIINDRPEGIIPTAGGRFTIVRHDYTVDDELICEYRVYSYRTLVAFVTFHPYSVRIPTIRVCKDAFDHSRTTSKHLHRFITALLAPFDLKPDCDLHKWCSNSMWSVTSIPVTSI